MENKIFTEKIFPDCSLVPSKDATPQILWIKLSWTATKPQKFTKVSPLESFPLYSIYIYIYTCSLIVNMYIVVCVRRSEKSWRPGTYWFFRGQNLHLSHNHWPWKPTYRRIVSSLFTCLSRTKMDNSTRGVSVPVATVEACISSPKCFLPRPPSSWKEVSFPDPPPVEGKSGNETNMCSRGVHPGVHHGVIIIGEGGGRCNLFFFCCGRTRVSHMWYIRSSCS